MKRRQKSEGRRAGEASLPADTFSLRFDEKYQYQARFSESLLSAFSSDLPEATLFGKRLSPLLSVTDKGKPPARVGRKVTGPYGMAALPKLGESNYVSEPSYNC